MVSTVNHILTSITKEVLSMLGERASKALFLELRLLEISIKPEAFDIVKVDEGLKKIFGSAAALFMEEIYTEFKTRLSEEGISTDEIEMKEEDITAAEKISRLLTLKPTT